MGFVAALREAIAERGPPPQPAKPRASNPQGTAASVPKVLKEADVMAQMQELSTLGETLAEGDLSAAAAAGEVACQETEAVAKAGNEVEEITDGPSVTPNQSRQERRSAAPVGSDAALEVKRAVKRRPQPLPCTRNSGQRPTKRQQREVVVSDGEEEACTVVGAASISLDDDDDTAEASIVEPDDKQTATPVQQDITFL